MKMVVTMTKKAKTRKREKMMRMTNTKRTVSTLMKMKTHRKESPTKRMQAPRTRTSNRAIQIPRKNWSRRNNLKLALTMMRMTTKMRGTISKTRRLSLFRTLNKKIMKWTIRMMTMI